MGITAIFVILAVGPASRYLLGKLTRIEGLRIMEVEHKIFPDGESYIRFPEDVSGEDLIVLQGTHPPQDRHLIQAILIGENALDLGARSIVLISPYLAYARQDKRFLDGEAVSIKTILRILHQVGYRKIYTINIHSPWIAEESPIPLIDLRAEKILAKYLKEAGLGDSFIVSMGKKGEEMARMVAEELNTDYASAKSSRDRRTGEVKIELGEVSAEKAVVVDDIISTGGTMASVVKELKRMGVRKVYAACIHALLVGGAVEKIMGSGAERIIASDTIPNTYAEYSIIGLIEEAIRRELR